MPRGLEDWHSLPAFDHVRQGTSDKIIFEYVQPEMDQEYSGGPRNITVKHNENGILTSIDISV